MRVLALVASLLIAGPSMAQSQLLVELRNTTMICVDCRPIDMEIVTRAGTPSGSGRGRCQFRQMTSVQRLSCRRILWRTLPPH